MRHACPFCGRQARQIDWVDDAHLFAERDTVELVEHGLVEAFTDAVGLRALGLGARVIDVLDRKVEILCRRGGRGDTGSV